MLEELCTTSSFNFLSFFANSYALCEYRETVIFSPMGEVIKTKKTSLSVRRSHKRTLVRWWWLIRSSPSFVPPSIKKGRSPRALLHLQLIFTFFSRMNECLTLEILLERLTTGSIVNRDRVNLYKSAPQIVTNHMAEIPIFASLSHILCIFTHSRSV